jgi:hypothetical protein
MPGPAAEIEKTAERGLKEAKHIQKEVKGFIHFLSELDAPSMAVGFGAALVAVLVFTVMKKTASLVLKLGLLIGAIVFFGGAYFGWLQR